MGRWIGGEADETEGLLIGPPVLHDMADPVHDAVQIHPDVFCGDAHNTNALTLEPRVAHLIFARLIRLAMNQPIDLNAQLRLSAVEVQNIDADGMLTTKLRPVQRPPSQRDP